MQFAKILLLICYLASFIVTRRHLRKGDKKIELNHHCVYQFFGTQCNKGMECDERRGSRCKRKEDEPCIQQGDCMTNYWCNTHSKCQAIVF